MSISQKEIEYWLDSAKRDSKTAQDLFNTKHYDACLFFCHLTIEKLLKCIILKVTHESPPYIHNLNKLAKIAKLELSSTIVTDFEEITSFNILGRYEDYKFEFYKKCTKQFTSTYLNISMKHAKWLKENYLKK